MQISLIFFAQQSSVADQMTEQRRTCSKLSTDFLHSGCSDSHNLLGRHLHVRVLHCLSYVGFDP